nr:histidine phosphatase family protein [Deinobacterium chartae]
MIRHGENLANLARELSCRRVDRDLTERGRLQAEQVAAYLQGLGIRALFASPLRRAQQTAEPLARALGRPVTLLEGLRELNAGDLEVDGEPHTLEARWREHDEVLAAWRAGDRARRFPGGENWHELQARSLEAWSRILEAPGDAAVFGHSGQIKLTLPELCPDLDAALLRASMMPGSVTEVAFDAARPSGGRLIRFADAAHLSGDAAIPTPVPSFEQLIQAAVNEVQA